MRALTVLQRALRPARRRRRALISSDVREPARAADLDLAGRAGTTGARSSPSLGSARTSMSVSEREGVPFAVRLAVVVADHERDRGLAGQGNLRASAPLSSPRRVFAATCGDGLVEVEVRAAGGSGHEHEGGDAEPGEDLPEPIASRERRARGGCRYTLMGVAAPGGRTALPFPFGRRAAPQTSLQSRSHTTKSAARRPPDGGYRSLPSAPGCVTAKRARVRPARPRERRSPRACPR